MDRQTIIEKLTEIVCNNLGIEPEEVTLDSSIREDFEADSIDMVDIIMDVEDEFNVEVPDEVLDNLIYVKDVVDHIEKNM